MTDRKGEPWRQRPESRDEYDPRHSHERREDGGLPIAPVFDDDGRCLVCALVVARDAGPMANSPDRPVLLSFAAWQAMDRLVRLDPEPEK